MNLDDVTVIDFTHSLPGPYATQLLADMGAEIIKIEPPAGDAARSMEITGEEVGGLYELVNRGKKSIVVDLKTGHGRDIICRLVQEADAVIEQFRPGVTERLEIGFNDLTECNENIVYCSLTGYGQEGPYADRVGHDLNYIGIAGLLDMTRKNSTDSPVIPGYPVGDMAGGLFAALTIVSALLGSRTVRSDSEFIDISITDVTFSFSQAIAASTLFGDQPIPGETELTGDYPCYNVYETADGEFVTLAALEPKFWRKFCSTINRPDLKDKHKSDDEEVRQEVHEELCMIFKSKPRSKWKDTFCKKDVMFGTVNSIDEAMNDPQISGREMVLTDHDGAPRIGFPAETTTELKEPIQSAPDLGEHSREILEALEYTEGEIEKLLDQNIVK